MTKLWFFSLVLISTIALARIGWKGDRWNSGSNAISVGVVSLIADDQVVDVSMLGGIKFNSDDATATNRTILLTAGSDPGQRLVLYFKDATDAMELLDNSALSGAGGNVRLSADWTPGHRDVVSLIWDNTDWVELSRSDN